MYTLKSVARRSTLFGAASALLAATIFPAAAVFADALNPLTERSLMLSSSAPGFTDTDGSGNSNTSPNSIGQNYAPAGSGPNGKKTGETFSFKVSSDSPIRAFTLQYCTLAAGKCRAPGNNTTGTANGNTAGSWNDSRSDLEVKDGWTQGSGAGQFQISVDKGSGAVASTAAWTYTGSNQEAGDWTSTDPEENFLTGKKNFITLSTDEADDNDVLIENGDIVTITFKASESVYITNPGKGSFFVKMNTFSDEAATTYVDGGVTVANVMTDSIHITTKVLETMAFSVGTRNRDTVTLNCVGYPSQATIDAGCEGDENASLSHGTCDPISQVNANRLNLGNPNSEYSLETRKAWGVNSYWRLSSNSSGGATVYYSGNTLANTVGDEIAEMPTETASQPGTEQFGLGFVDANEDTMSADFQALVAQPDNRWKNPTSAPFVTLQGQSGAEFPINQTASADYDEADGTLDDGNGGAGDAKFKFLKSSLTSPEPIAQQNSEVISCATAKMRYVANIGADTPAGVYTTKVNYLAAPQY